MNETVREMLNRLEKTLEDRVSGLRKELAPLEIELADIRRAKAALGDAEKPKAEKDSTWEELLGPLPENINLTMKQLTLKALREHFPQGATANQLLDFFDHAWGRTDIVRSSLSPQLSRLKAERKIKRKGLIWYLVQQPQKNEAPTGDQPESASEGGEASTSPNESPDADLDIFG